MMTTKKSSIESWLISMGIDLKYVTIHPDYIVDVDNEVNLNNKKLTYLPIQFGLITGNFNCAENSLISLKGSPREVGGYFDCSRNQLASLAYCPQKIQLDFNASKNNIVSLDYCPQYIGDYFYIEDNPLVVKNSIYFPSHIGKKIYLPLNENNKYIFSPFYNGITIAMTLEQLISCYRHYQLESQLLTGHYDSKLKL